MKLNVLVVTLLLSLILAAGCRRTAEESSSTTENTVTPATLPASPATETDAALTQTVEIGEERSPNEGGVLTDRESGSTGDGVSPAAAPATSTVDPSTATAP